MVSFATLSHRWLTVTRSLFCNPLELLADKLVSFHDQGLIMFIVFMDAAVYG